MTTESWLIAVCVFAVCVAGAGCGVAIWTMRGLVLKFSDQAAAANHATLAHRQLDIEMKRLQVEELKAQHAEATKEQRRPLDVFRKVGRDEVRVQMGNDSVMPNMVSGAA